MRGGEMNWTVTIVALVVLYVFWRWRKEVKNRKVERGYY